MRTVFVDTGAWLALLERHDSYHAQASMHYDRLAAAGVGFLTTNYVIDETATRLRYDVGLRAALAFRASLTQLSRAGRARVIWIDERIEAEGWHIMEQYADLRLSLTDATSAAVARASRITEVFGFDAHFEALGFVVAPQSRND